MRVVLFIIALCFCVPTVGHAQAAQSRAMLDAILLAKSMRAPFPHPVANRSWLIAGDSMVALGGEQWKMLHADLDMIAEPGRSVSQVRALIQARANAEHRYSTVILWAGTAQLMLNSWNPAPVIADMNTLIAYSQSRADRVVVLFPVLGSAKKTRKQADAIALVRDGIVGADVTVDLSAVYGALPPDILYPDAIHIRPEGYRPILAAVQSALEDIK